MILNNAHRFIYIHVPKTAGTTVSAALARYAGPVAIDLGGDVPPYEAGRPDTTPEIVNKLWHAAWGVEKHTRVMRLRKRLGPRIWDGYFKFAFVRNPFARTYSGYRYARQGPVMGEALKGMSFSDFLRSEYFRELKILPIQSQAAFLDPLPQLDFIGRFETLAEDLALAASIIERRRAAPFDLPVRNRSAQPDEWRDMSEADRDIIRAVLAEDFAKLGYSPEDGEPLGPLKTR